MTQETLADMAGLDRTYISMLERGTRNPSVATIEKLALAMNTTGWEILKFAHDRCIKNL